jgi:2-oxoglutarate dehydrogenase E1 component
LCAEDNIRVAYPSTAANYFHLLRRQVHEAERKPLVVFTPKRYLRMPATHSPVDAFTSGGFEKIIVDAGTVDPSAVKRLIVCTGKIAHELAERRDKAGAPAVIVRVEQLYPIPVEELTAALLHYPALDSVVWVQEEPENMGARIYARQEMRTLVPDHIESRSIARDASASPASGSAKVHDAEQEQILSAAFAGL